MSKDKKGEVGAPTKYKEEYCEQARKLCLLGHTDKDLAKFFEVTEKTINNWKKEHPEFLQSIKKAKAMVDSDVAEKLYLRAIGYSHPEVKVFCNEGVITEHEVTKHYAPDVTAAAIWLKNRQPEFWNDKKATAPFVDFDFKDGNTPLESANQILVAVANKRIPPDIGALLINTMSAVLKIEEVTDLEDRIKQLEALQDG